MALTNRQAVRLKVGDNDASAQLLTDDEVDFFLDQNGDNLNLSAAEALESLAANVAQLAKRQETSEFQIERRSTSEYLTLAKQLRDEEKNKPATAVAQLNVSPFEAATILANRD